MAFKPQRIIPLTLETQSHIRSAVQISSLSDVVLELVKNSLDANARHIDVRLDFSKGYCSILDDGNGILKEEFLEDGGLARLYHTSKGINDGHIYGQYGRFLASLATLSLLSITSRHQHADLGNSVVLTDGKRIASSIAISDDESGLQKHGTRVTVHNLFGKMPVRVKHRLARLERRTEVEREFSILKKVLTGLILAAKPSFVLDMREGTQRFLYRPTSMDSGTLGSKLDLEHIASTLSQAGLLDSARTDTWRQVSIRSSDISLQAAVNLQPAPTKAVQFISLNHCPLPNDLATSLSDLVNVLFDKSAFGNAATTVHNENYESSCQQKSRMKNLTRSQKEINRWPMFYIRVETDAALPPERSNQMDANKLVTLISGLLQALFTEFLQSTGFSSFDHKTRTRQPLSPMQFNTSTSHFDGWSRIKSGDGSQPDLSSGLPFMSRRDPCSISSQTVNQTENQPNIERLIQWTNPRTGNILQINPRTGMVLPSKRLEALPLCNIHRKLDDVMNSLSDYVSYPRVEQALKSVTPVYDALGSKHKIRTDEHVCTQQSDRSLRISGPTQVEAGCFNVTKDHLLAAKVLGQVDGKFILASLVSDHTTLVMIDQHAADERVKVEELFEQLCTSVAIPLTTSITFEVNQQEIQRFQSLQGPLATWEIKYSISKNHVRVTALPELIVEKCRLEPKLLISLLRREIWREHSLVVTKPDHWLSKLSACPQGILDMLISRACRSAIMFNDKLSIEQCQALIQRLGGCLFPFQCAHGRPSLTTVARIQDTETQHESTFGAAWKAWN